MLLPDKVKQIIQILLQNGYEAYAVGGCVRDSLLGRTPEDWDITTSARPETVKQLFRRTVDTGLQHGTVTVLLGGDSFEVTTYRIDGKYEDCRHPKEVLFTPSLAEDLKRRDFTVNAMAYNETDGLVDLYDGQADLERGVIRCVGNATDRFQEDALRMLRAVRFSAQLDFTIEKQTEEAIRKLAGNLSKISAERIQVELVKLLTSPHPERMRTVYELGISKVILPEFDRLMQTEQNHVHHCYSVGEHTICGICGVLPDKILRLSMLFHDIAKPECMTVDEEGVTHFYGHPVEGEKLTRQILRRLKFDRDTIERVCALVRWHDYNPQLEPRQIRKAIVKVGEKQYPAIFAIKRADILAQSMYQREEKLAYVDAYEAQYHQIMERKDCISLKQLQITGKDLIRLGVPQGAMIGTVLKQLLEEIIEHPEYNQQEWLLERAKQVIKEHPFA